MIFFNDNGATFNEYGHFMSHNWIVRVLEIGLFVGILVHVIQGFMLWSMNAKSRKINYNVQPGNATSKWYSRSMGLLGTIILLFLVIHLSHFWLGTKVNLYLDGDGEHNMFNEMKGAFSNLWIVIVYVLGCISLSWHLIHGFKSAFQTLGINSPKYNGMIQNIGIVFSIVVPFIFAMMPISMYLGWIS